MEPLAALSVSVEHDSDGTPVVVLAGQLDLATAPHAERAFEALPVPTADGDGASPVVVDMTELTFMDSTGLTVLLLAVNRGFDVRLRRPTPLVARVIDVTGLTETLPIEP